MVRKHNKLAFQRI
jgi:hypothetical protein